MKTLSTTSSASFPLSLVQQFAPTIKFHPDEIFLPCTIEYLLGQSTLRANVAMQIPNQSISGDNSGTAPAPSYTYFNNNFILAYEDGNGNILITSSSDGMTGWSSPFVLCQGSSPSMTVHSDGNLWMAYVYDETIHMTYSSDGKSWQPSWSIPDQATFNTALASLNGELWIVYSSNSGSQLYSTNSSDGHSWDCRAIDGNTSRPAITTLNGLLWIVYSGSSNSTMYSASSSDGVNWNTNTIDGQHTSVPSLTTFNGALCMTYSDSNGSDMFASTSTDGINWNVSPIPNLFSSIPAIAASSSVISMVTPDSDPYPVGNNHMRQLWASLSLDGLTWQFPDINNPTQQDMATHFSGQYYLDIDDSAFKGEGLTAPMYYAVQSFADYTEITYILFFGFNGCQTVHIPFSDNICECILYNYARHQGDLERVTIRISNDSNPQILDVCTESHGDASHWTLDQVSLASGTSSVIIHSSLNAHGTFNKAQQGTWISKDNVTLADFGDAIGEGGVWTPSEYRLVGLDSQSNPVNDQVWAKFCGRIGNHLDNSLTAGTDYQRNDLSTGLWDYIKVCNAIASGFNSLPADATSGDGPSGLGTRPYIRPVS